METRTERAQRNHPALVKWRKAILELETAEMLVTQNGNWRIAAQRVLDASHALAESVLDFPE